MRLFQSAWAGIKALLSIKLRLPRFGEITALLSILGLGGLCYLAGAAAMYFHWPTSETIEKALQGTKSWLELDRKHVGKPLSWRGVENKVSVDQPGKTYDGFTLYTTSLAARAMLIDMSGKLVHTWEFPFSAAWPNPPHVRSAVSDRHVYWFGCHAFPNGDLLAVYHGDGDTPYGYGLVKLDKDSKLLWAYAGNVHHNIDVGEDGTIYAVTQKLAAKALDGLESIRAPFIADTLVVLSPEGKELKSIPIMEAFRDSPFSLMLALVNNTMTKEDQIQAKYFPPRQEAKQEEPKKETKPDARLEGPAAAKPKMPRLGSVGTPGEFAEKGDYLHVNSVKVLSRALAPQFPLFKAGQVLISLRNLDALAVVDLEARSIAWAVRGLWRRQHSADFLENGHLLLYDNVGSTQQTRVIEYDPKTQAFPWTYANESSAPFLAHIMGSAQRLPNKNTLIVDPALFRIFEITEQKELVWEVAAGRPGRDDETSLSRIKMSVISGTRRYGADELSFLKGQAQARP